jgi:predicted RNA-binding Zn-ribbon protein involved in translation (DUF1610 family)
MNETRCRICRSFLDPEDLFCSNCGTENLAGLDADGIGVEMKSEIQAIASVLSFQCEQCGASMSYDASAKQLRCPFCGSEKLMSRPSARTLQPKYVVPFRIERQAVDGLLRNWLSQGFWRPGDASTESVISKVTPVFVPFWIFSANTEIAWTADTSAVPPGARSNWYPISGTTEKSYDGVLVGASATLTPLEVREICPFDLSQGIAPEQVDLNNIVVEEFRTTRRDARMIAQGILEQLAGHQVEDTIRGKVRNLHINIRAQDLQSVPVLLPTWIMVYHYKDKPFRVLVNGQTGEVVGMAPFSSTKLLMVILGVFAFFLIVILVVIFVSYLNHL